MVGLRDWRAKIRESEPEGLGAQVRLLVIRFGLQAICLLAFLFGGLLVNRLLNLSVPPDFMTGKAIIQAITATWFVDARAT